MPVFYPAAGVRFRLRFDEDLLGKPGIRGVEVDARTLANSSTPPGTISSGGVTTTPPSTNPSTTSGPAVILNGVLQKPNSIPRVKRLNLPGQDPGFNRGGDSQDGLTVIHERVPLDCSIEESSWRKAGQFKLVMTWKDFPIDPQMIRACGVDICLDSITPGAFAKGMGSNPYNSEGGFAAQIKMSDANLRMTGIVDSFESEHSLHGDVVHLEGRDVRCIFLDTPLRPNMLAQIKCTNPLPLVVAQILSAHPFGSDWTVDGGPASAWPNGVYPIPGNNDATTRVRQGALGANTRMSLQGNPHSMNFWDLIVHMCTLCGAIPYISTTLGPAPQGTFATIKLIPAKNIFVRMQQQGTDPNNLPPFKGNQPRVVRIAGEQDQTLKFRKMVYGRNIESIHLRRHHSKGAKIVEVVSLNTSSAKVGTSKLITARFPNIPDPDTSMQGGTPQGTGSLPPGVGALFSGEDQSTLPQTASQATAPLQGQGSQPSPSGNTAQSNVIYVSVPGINNKEQLANIAESIWYEIAHGELSGTCVTKDLASFGNQDRNVGVDADLLSLRVGDPIAFDTNAQQLATLYPSVSELSRALEPQFEAAVRRAVGNQKLADLIVQSSKNGALKMQEIFRVDHVHWSWKGGQSPSFLCSFDFQEYIDVRDKDVGKTKRQKPKQQTAPTPRTPHTNIPGTPTAGGVAT